MAPFALPHEVDNGAHEVLERQDTAHYHPNIQPRMFLDSIQNTVNSVLHATKSSDANNNGSQAGSSGGFLTTPPGQGEQEEETDVAVILSLFIPLAATVTAIFIIALFVRKMRRSESAHEVHHHHHRKNEFQMTPRKKTSSNSTNSVLSSSTISSTTSTATSHMPVSHSHSGANNLSATARNGISKSQILDGNSTNLKSLYRNSSYFRLGPHQQLQYHSSLPGSIVSKAPSGPTPWPLAPDTGYFYRRSHYGLNKLQQHQQLYQHASLQVFSSMQSLNGIVPVTRQYSDPQTYCTQSDPEIEVSSEDGNSSKKSSQKKLQRVLSAMNFPRRIKQYQADRKRFNIYTIPTETREQLKHIYVY